MKLFFNAIALNDEKLMGGGENVSKNFLQNNGYIKNSFVSLFSAKKENPDIEVALFINFNMPEQYKKIFQENDIQIYNLSFDEYKFPDKMKWSLAFYKLCALKYAVTELDFDSYCMVDTDTLCQRSLEELWKECEQNILLYDMQHSLDIEQAVQMNKEYLQLVGVQRNLTNYGGEFIAGSRNQLRQFIQKCDFYYQKMLQEKLYTKHGDEFLICCAAEDKEIKVMLKPANAYIYRFWTSRFYLISTNYIYNPVTILHLPDEKNRGMICLYNYVMRHHSLPKGNKLFSMINLPRKKGRILISLQCWRHIIHIKLLNAFLMKKIKR